MKISIHLFLLFLALSLCCSSASANEDFSILFYNVENFFHPSNDSLTNDDEFTPYGSRHWNYTRYNYKADAIAKVIVSACQDYNYSATNTCQDNTDTYSLLPFPHPAIVGLCEVENESCLKALTYRLRNLNYAYIHYDSPDPRGIDVAMLYDSTLITVLESKPISVYLDDKTTTRDILYARCTVKKLDISETLETFKPFETYKTLYLFVCHLPSQLGGAKKTQWKRDKALTILRHHTDSILSINPNAQIIVMGDMNSKPMDNLTPLINKSLKTKKNCISAYSVAQGTHRYNGIWTSLDQFYVSPALDNKIECTIYDAPYLLEKDSKYLGYKPKRTYVGFRYQPGYSDHLPILLYFPQP